MKQSVVAFVGISGVGKSTALKCVSEAVPFQHLQASALIKQAREELTNSSACIDELRSSNIADNQMLLVQGFSRAIDRATPLVILDGHTVVDTPSGLVRIKPEIFGQIGVQHFVFLCAPPASILIRRAGDFSRNRPARTEEELREHQHQALLCTFQSALALDVPLTVVTPGNIELVADIFRRLRE